MARKKQEWASGDVFEIPLEDGTVTLGQVIGWEGDAMNSVAVVLFDDRAPQIDSVTAGMLDNNKIISVVLSTRDLLDGGHWRVRANAEVSVPWDMRPYEKFRPHRFVGAKIYGSGIVRKFLNAYYALAPWDMMLDPLYFDRMLLHPQKKPRSLIYKNAPN